MDNALSLSKAFAKELKDGKPVILAKKDRRYKFVVKQLGKYQAEYKELGKELKGERF